MALPIHQYIIIFYQFIKVHRKFIICCENADQTRKIVVGLSKTDIKHRQIERFAQIAKLTKYDFFVTDLEISNSYIYKNFTFIAARDFLHEINQKQQKIKNINLLVQELSELKSGEIVVHETFGIGKFLGLETMNIMNVKRDFLKLEYKNGDHIFVSVENLSLITKYGSQESSKLDNLNAQNWQEKRKNVKKKIFEIAKDMMQNAAARNQLENEKFTYDEDNYYQFCSLFPHVLTEDQVKTMEEVEADLSAGNVFERLICGDVGFGKTEIAMRAAFIVAACGMQVAILAPTSLLVRQHFRNFEKRFANFPLKIVELSQMCGTKQLKINRELISVGGADIIIGTHALLNKDLQFSNIGLLIIDEEQSFGVKQKEFLKERYSKVNCLMLSATPIPRTLQMSLSGIKDLSLIRTPPVNRMIVQTHVLEFDRTIIKNAILREVNRGGSVFFVTPYIKDIGFIEQELAKILEKYPEIIFKSLHGKMTPKNIDKTMNDFCSKHFQILISTPIIESGIDIAEANTIFINKANFFGLSQLYQLRGRVGRSKVAAYAYLFASDETKISDDATKRLNTMKSLDKLGCGFTLASHDMDIRGFGNLVGSEQSGYIKDVGVEMYQAMLQECINELDGKTDENLPNVEIKINISSGIPESFIENRELRLGLYQRLAKFANEEELTQFIHEIHDRFGEIPTETHNLLQIMKVKILCRQAKIQKVEIKSKVIFYFMQMQNPQKIIDFAMKNAHLVKFEPNDGMSLLKRTQNTMNGMKMVEKFAENFLNFIK